jgi:hypothetical protein
MDRVVALQRMEQEARALTSKENHGNLSSVT